MRRPQRLRPCSSASTRSLRAISRSASRAVLLYERRPISSCARSRGRPPARRALRSPSCSAGRCTPAASRRRHALEVHEGHRHVARLHRGLVDRTPAIAVSVARCTRRAPGGPRVAQGVDQRAESPCGWRSGSGSIGAHAPALAPGRANRRIRAAGRRESRTPPSQGPGSASKASKPPIGVRQRVAAAAPREHGALQQPARHGHGLAARAGAEVKSTPISWVNIAHIVAARYSLVDERQPHPRRGLARRHRRVVRTAARWPSSMPTAACVLRAGRHRAPGLSALGGQGAAGAAAGGQRRGRAAGSSTTRNWRWPAPRTTASRRTCAAARPCWPRPAWTRPRWNAAPTGPTTRPSSAMAARGEVPSALHNNCSGKHAGFVCLGCLMAGRRATARAFCRGYVKPDHPVMREVTHGAAGRHRLRPVAGRARHRRLLDPDLRDPAAPPGAGLRARGHRHRPAPGPCPRGAAAAPGGGGARLSWSAAPTASTRA